MDDVVGAAQIVAARTVMSDGERGDGSDILVQIHDRVRSQKIVLGEDFV